MIIAKRILQLNAKTAIEDDNQETGVLHVGSCMEPIDRPEVLPGPTVEKSKSVPLQAWSGKEGSRKLRFPDFMTTAQDGGKVVSLTHRPPLPPRKYSWYSFLLEAESTPGP